MYYAHSRNARGQRHALVTHLRSVADLAADFAAAFGASEPARYLGLWHDLGKFNPVFRSICATARRIPLRTGTCRTIRPLAHNSPSSIWV
jgi:HD superfamily phosphohydrolase YqeK